MHITRLTVGLATSLAVLGLVGCGSGGEGGSGADGDGTKVRIAHNTNAANLPARVAHEQGFFEEEGLNVDFKVVENISTLPPALGKSFEIVQTAPTNMITASSEGIPMVAVSGATVDTEASPTAAVIASKKSGVTDIKGLKGKTLGVLNETGTLHTAFKAWLKDAGVPLDSVNTVQVDGPAMADQLRAGRVDAVETIAPFHTTILENEDTVDLGDPYLQMAPEIGAILWGSQRDWAEKNPEAVESFRKAIAKAIKYIDENEDEAKKVLQDYTGLSDEIIADTKLPTYTAELRPQDLEVWLEAMRKLDFKGEVELSDLVPAED